MTILEKAQKLFNGNNNEAAHEVAEHTKRRETTDVQALSTVELVDQLGDFNELRKSLATREEALKKELKKRGLGRYAGERYEATVYQSSSQYLDKDAVLRRLGEDWVREHTLVKDYTACAVKPLPEITE